MTSSKLKLKPTFFIYRNQRGRGAGLLIRPHWTHSPPLSFTTKSLNNPFNANVSRLLYLPPFTLSLTTKSFSSQRWIGYKHFSQLSWPHLPHLPDLTHLPHLSHLPRLPHLPHLLHLPHWPHLPHLLHLPHSPPLPFTMMSLNNPFNTNVSPSPNDPTCKQWTKWGKWGKWRILLNVPAAQVGQVGRVAHFN